MGLAHTDETNNKGVIMLNFFLTLCAVMILMFVIIEVVSRIDTDDKY